ncbi:hypothetical protein MRX96_027554 [Rhipicephalus microplus]
MLPVTEEKREGHYPTRHEAGGDNPMFRIASTAEKRHVQRRVPRRLNDRSLSKWFQVADVSRPQPALLQRTGAACSAATHRRASPDARGARSSRTSADLSGEKFAIANDLRGTCFFRPDI